MNSDNFSPTKANRAQIKYCDEHECPVFAPMNGVCYRCGYNIYLPTNGKNAPEPLPLAGSGSAAPAQASGRAGRASKALRSATAISGPRGITVEEAGSRLITSCPHCSYSFVE